MTAERVKGLLEITCDGDKCTNFVSGSGNFKSVWDEAKAEGWKASMAFGEWFHYCASCSKPQEADLSKITKGL